MNFNDFFAVNLKEAFAIDNACKDDIRKYADYKYELINLLDDMGAGVIAMGSSYFMRELTHYIPDHKTVRMWLVRMGLWTCTKVKETRTEEGSKIITYIVPHKVGSNLWGILQVQYTWRNEPAVASFELSNTWEY